MDKFDQSIFQYNNSDENFSFVSSPARIAIYDDLKSSPRIVEIQPEETKSFIGKLSSEIYNLASQQGGKIAFSIIKQVTENFIHAHFSEIVISILDHGNQIKFSDQGPGIIDKEKIFTPGFTSATNEMKKYIDGVGSGLPIAKEYIDVSNGEIKVEDNLDHGTVITLSLNKKEDSKAPFVNDKYSVIVNNLSQRSIQILKYLDKENVAGVVDISKNLSIPQSSTHVELKKLEDKNLIAHVGTKRTLSSLGREICLSL